jgi:hypothetical protein
LQKRARKSGFDRPPRNRLVISSRVNVRREHRQEQEGESERRIGSGRRQHESDCSQKFQHSSHGDKQVRPRKGGRNHLNQVRAAFAPVGGGCQQEHSGQSQAKRGPPAVRNGYTEAACNIQEHKQDNQNGKRDHRLPIAHITAFAEGYCAMVWRALLSRVSTPSVIGSIRELML